MDTYDIVNFIPTNEKMHSKEKYVVQDDGIIIILYIIFLLYKDICNIVNYLFIVLFFVFIRQGQIWWCISPYVQIYKLFSQYSQYRALTQSGWLEK
jgi:hypothetical protein